MATRSAGPKKSNAWRNIAIGGAVLGAGIGGRKLYKSRRAIGTALRKMAGKKPYKAAKPTKVTKKAAYAVGRATGAKVVKSRMAKGSRMKKIMGTPEGLIPRRKLSGYANKVKRQSRMTGGPTTQAWLNRHQRDGLSFTGKLIGNKVKRGVRRVRRGRY